MDFDAIMSKIGEVAQSGVAKAKDLAEIAKLKVNNATEQDAIRKAYAEMGKLYFAQHASDPDPEFAALCAKVTECQERIAYNNERISDIKHADGITDADIEAMAAQIPLDDPAPDGDDSAPDAPDGDAPQS